MADKIIDEFLLIMVDRASSDPDSFLREDFKVPGYNNTETVEVVKAMKARGLIDAWIEDYSQQGAIMRCRILEITDTGMERGKRAKARSAKP